MQKRSSEMLIDGHEARVLRAAFVAGAVTDAGALLTMPVPSLATVLWGLRDVSGGPTTSDATDGVRFRRPHE